LTRHSQKYTICFAKVYAIFNQNDHNFIVVVVEKGTRRAIKAGNSNRMLQTRMPFLMEMTITETIIKHFLEQRPLQQP
jgi:hypothetical protein